MRSTRVHLPVQGLEPPELLGVRMLFTAVFGLSAHGPVLARPRQVLFLALDGHIPLP